MQIGRAFDAIRYYTLSILYSCQTKCLNPVNMHCILSSFCTEATTADIVSLWPKRTSVCRTFLSLRLPSDCILQCIVCTICMDALHFIIIRTIKSYFAFSAKLFEVKTIASVLNLNTLFWHILQTSRRPVSLVASSEKQFIGRLFLTFSSAWNA